jgi:hypothetical protein
MCSLPKWLDHRHTWRSTVGVWSAMSPIKTFTTSASWSSWLDYEKQQEHDFCNLLQEFRYALLREDQKLIEYCESELKRMYRERRQVTEKQVTRA